MKSLNLPIDKPLIEFTDDELKHLAWNTVDASEFHTLTEREVRNCPILYLINRPINYESFSPKFLMTLIQAAVKSSKSRSGYLSEVSGVLNVLPREFVVDNIDEIMEIMSMYSINKPTVFSSVYTTLIHNGLLDINTIPLLFSHIAASSGSFSNKIPRESWMRMYKETNTLYYIFNSEPPYDSYPLFMSTKEIESFGLPAIPGIDIEKYLTKSRTYDDDEDLLRYMSRKKSQGCTGVITWDTVLDDYYSGISPDDEMVGFWWYIMSDITISPQVISSLHKPHLSTTMSEHE